MERGGCGENGKGNGNGGGAGPPLENEQRQWRNSEDGRAGNKENRLAWRDPSKHLRQDRWYRDEQRRSRIFDGKNTLQRSMSSPEFQAELMQVARKVRNKLHCSGGRSSVEACMERNVIDADRCVKEPKLAEETKRPEKRSARNDESSNAIEDRIVEERRLIERCSRSESKLNVYEERKERNTRDPARTNKDYLEERQAESGGKRRLVEKSATFEETAIVRSKDPPARRVLKDRPDVTRHSADARFPSEKQRRDLLEDYQRAKSASRCRKYEDATDPGRTRSESPVRPCIRTTDPREQGSGRESTPERTSEAKERERERDSDRRWRKNETARNTAGTPDDRRWPCEPVSASATEKKDSKSKERLTRKAEVKEVVREKNWHV